MLHTLNVAQTGLKTAQTQTENVMNNIANQNVEGYKKRVVNISEIDHADARITGRGVWVNDVSRVTNIYMYQNLVKEESKFSEIQELNSILGDIESIFSETDEAGVSPELNQYFKSIENLRTSPHNEVYKNDIQNSAESLVLGLKNLYQDIEQKEDLLLDETKEIVDKVNSILTEIGSISKKIVESIGGTPNDLLDKRDTLEKELAQYVDVEISREERYHLKVAGVTAVRFDTNVHDIQLVENYTPKQDIYAKIDATTGNTNTTGINGDFISSFPNTAFTDTDGAIARTAEVQTIEVTGTYDTTGNINFLGTAVTPTGTTATQIATDIAADANVITNWNAANPHREINTITSAGAIITITYVDTEGDMPPLEASASNGYYFANSVETTTGSAPVVSETQTIDIFGSVDDGSGDPAGTAKTINFLGHSVATTMGADASALATNINAVKGAYGDADGASIIGTWNANNPDKEINDIRVNPMDPNELQIEYRATEGDIPSIDGVVTDGIEFTGSIESVKGSTESLTYILNDKHKITVTIGETINDAQGNPVDFDQSGAGEGGIGNVTEDNIIQALVHKINQDNEIGSVVTAYNGRYELSDNGYKLTTDEPNHSKYEAAGTQANVDGHADRYLFIEANKDGEKGTFTGELLINDNNTRYYESRNELVSKDAMDDIHLEVYEKEITVSSGELRPMLDNLRTNAENNLIQEYKEKLDLFVQKLSDLTESFIENSDGTYTFGEDNVSVDYDADKAININLFTGSTVSTLEFNEGNVRYLTQQKLDYLAELQWKSDINFDGTGENNQSFSEYFQTLRVSIADDRENVIFNEEAQEAVRESLQNTYDQLTKVDKDEEMVNLIKFQSAYEANAKVITTVDQMLETLLGLKR